jgi:hypothetical protein
MLNTWLDAFLAFSFVIVSITYLIAFARQQRLHRHLRVAFLLYACGMLAVAAALIAPHIQPDTSRYEPLMKALSALTLLGACILSWPLIR